MARLVVGGLLVCLGLVTGTLWALRRREVRFVVYEALPWPGAPWLAGSLLVFALALMLPIPAIWRTVLVGLGCGGIAAGLLGGSFIGAGRGDEDASYPVAQASYRLVVHRGGFFDPIYFLSVEQQSGPLSRSWYLGCLDGDYDWIEEARWEQPGLFRMVTSGEEHVIQIRVNPTTGRPLDPARIATSCDYSP